MLSQKVTAYSVLAWLFAATCAVDAMAQPGRAILPGHVPAVVAQLTPKGRLPPTSRLALAIGLPLRNVAELERLLADLYDPANQNYRKFLTPPEFATRFGPTEGDYAAVQGFARAYGLTVAATHPNRVV